MGNECVAIHQPDFLPHLGFFYKLVCCDQFVILDHVQFPRAGWVHRDLIKDQCGDVKWLTVQTIKNRYSARINEIKISDDREWRDKHKRIIFNAYNKARYYSDVYAMVSDIYDYKTNNLLEFNVNALRSMFSRLGLSPSICYSSDFNLNSSKSELMAELVCKVGGKVYLAGQGSRDYHDNEPFDKRGVDVIWSNYAAPKYEQVNGDFVNNLSILDYLFNCGFSSCRDLLKSWRR